MARKSERIKKKPDDLHYTHLTAAEKMRKSRRKLRRLQKKKKTDRKLKGERKANSAKTKQS